jgi:DNA-binding NtrC family response regulator
MPGVAFDVCNSREEGLSKLKAGHYHAVLTDAWSAEAEQYALLTQAQTLSCPIPVVLSERNGDSQAVSGALTYGALDIIRFPATEGDASRVMRRALWLYQIRLMLYTRRRRLSEYLSHHSQFTAAMSDQRRQAMERALQDVESINQTCERTLKQLESSLDVLEKISRQFESDVRNCALRILHLL